MEVPVCEVTNETWSAEKQLLPAYKLPWVKETVA